MKYEEWCVKCGIPPDDYSRLAWNTGKFQLAKELTPLIRAELARCRDERTKGEMRQWLSEVLNAYGEQQS